MPDVVSQMQARYSPQAAAKAAAVANNNPSSLSIDNNATPKDGGDDGANKYKMKSKQRQALMYKQIAIGLIVVLALVAFLTNTHIGMKISTGARHHAKRLGHHAKRLHHHLKSHRLQNHHLNPNTGLVAGHHKKHKKKGEQGGQHNKPVHEKIMHALGFGKHKKKHHHNKNKSKEDKPIKMNNELIDKLSPEQKVKFDKIVKLYKEASGGFTNLSHHITSSHELKELLKIAAHEEHHEHELGEKLDLEKQKQAIHRKVNLLIFDKHKKSKDKEQAYPYYDGDKEGKEYHDEITNEDIKVIEKQQHHHVKGEEENIKLTHHHDHQQNKKDHRHLAEHNGHDHDHHHGHHQHGHNHDQFDSSKSKHAHHASR